MKREHISTAARFLVNPTGTVIDLLTQEITEKVVGTDSATSLEKLEEEARRAEIKLATIQAEAKADQERAIAVRIANAIEVEIEEYYDVSGQGGLGVDTVNLSGGITGEGRKVVKRVIKFKGFAASSSMAERSEPAE